MAGLSLSFGQPLPPSGADLNVAQLDADPSVMLRSIADLTLLTECDYLVGSLSSQFFRVAVLLQHGVRDVVRYESIEGDFVIGHGFHGRITNFV